MEIIKLTPAKSKLEQNLENVEQPLQLVENCVRAAIQNLNESYSRFWNMSDEDIQSVFDYFGLDGVMSILTGHYTTAVALNTIRTLRGISGPEAFSTKPRDFEVDAEGRVLLIPIGGWPVVPEPWVDPRSIVGGEYYDERFDPNSPNYDEQYTIDNPWVDPVIPEEPIVDPEPEVVVPPEEPPVDIPESEVINTDEPPAEP